MNQTYCLLSTKSVGCTFVDWSIYYLSGQQRYYNVDNQTYYKVTDYPIIDSTAHLHNKNHPKGFVNTKKQVEYLQSLKQLSSVYPSFLTVNDCLKLLNLDNVTPDSAALTTKQMVDDFSEVVNYCVNNCYKTIVVDVDLDLPSMLYCLQSRSLSSIVNLNKKLDNSNSVLDEIDSVYYKNSTQQWANLNLTNIWDVRERRALDLRLVSAEGSVDPGIKNITQAHFYVNALDLWHNGQDILPKIIKFLDLEVDPSRYNHWAGVFKQWQQIQFNWYQFGLNCKHIVDSIVSNTYYPLTNLTLQQEIIIQHLLMYRFNLNLKTWQLSTFPANTQLLAELIEPNIHTLDSNYQELLSQFYSLR